MIREREVYHAIRLNTPPDTLHVTFDFAEKVHLPHFLNQPGQLFFTAPLRVDLFGIHCAPFKRTHVYCLPEGHWPGRKNADASMVEHTIRTKASGVPHLELTADNCAGQNRNHFILYYLCWRACLGLNQTITLRFLVVGHTKNFADAAFGLVKQRMRRQEVVTPAHLAKVVDDSAVSSECIPTM